MKTPLGVEVDLVTGHVVPAVRERGTAAPLFSPVSVVQKNKSKRITLVSYYIKHVSYFGTL